MTIPPDFEDIFAQLSLHEKNMELAQTHSSSSSSYKDVLQSNQAFIDSTCLLKKKIKELESRDYLDPSLIKILQTLQNSLSISNTKISDVCFNIYQDLYKLLNEPASNHQDLIFYGSFFLNTTSLIPEHRIYAHLCFERAAVLLEKENKIEEAYALRLSFINQTQSSLTLTESITPLSISSEGTLCSGFGAGNLKRGSFILKQRTFSDEGKKISLVFHVNSFLGNQIRERLRFLQENLTLLPVEFLEKAQVSDVENGYAGLSSETLEFSHNFAKYGITMEQAIQFMLKGTGKLTIGCSPQVLSLLNRVEVEASAEIPFENSIQNFYLLMALLGCGPVLEQSSSQEEERRKIAFLSHLFAPKATCRLQLSPSFYTCSPKNLMNNIVEAESHMKPCFAKYLNNPDLLKKISLSSTSSQLCITDLSEQLRQLGAVGLMTGFSGPPSQLASIFEHGLISSQKRFEQGLIVSGVSSDTDHQKGGAGYVFTRMLTKKMLDVKIRRRVPGERPREEPGCKVELFPCSGNYQILIDLEALNGGGYAYPRDTWGSKEPEFYASRLSFLELVPLLSLQDSTSNEWMIPERVDPGLIKGILVKSPFEKRMLIEYLMEEKLLHDIEGKFYFKSFLKRSIDELILTGTAFTSEMWQ